MSTAQNVDANDLKPGAPIWIDPSGKGEKIAANFGKMSADGSKFQAKIPKQGFEWYPVAKLAGLREAGTGTKAPSSASKSESEDSTKSTKEAATKTAATKTPKADTAEAHEKREARKKEKAEARAKAKEDRDARKKEKAEARAKKKEERVTQPKKSRGKGIRLKSDILEMLQNDIPLASTEEGDLQIPLNILAETFGKRVEDVEKSVDLLVEEGLATKETVTENDTDDKGEPMSFDVVKVGITKEGREYKKPASSRSKKESTGEEKEPMQKQIADLVRQHLTNEEIIERLSTPGDEEKGIEPYKLSKAFISTVRSRMRDPELYNFKYATAEDVDRDYLGERKTMDKKKQREERNNQSAEGEEVATEQDSEEEVQVPTPSPENNDEQPASTPEVV